MTTIDQAFEGWAKTKGNVKWWRDHHYESWRAGAEWALGRSAVLIRESKKDAGVSWRMWVDMMAEDILALKEGK